MNTRNRRALALLALLASRSLLSAQVPEQAPEIPAADVSESVAVDVPPSETVSDPAPDQTDASMLPAPVNESPVEQMADPSSAGAEVPATEPVVTESEAPLPVVVSTASASETSILNDDGKAKDTLSVDFPDEDIRNILRNVADLFELNIVIPDTLQGRTSIKLRDVTWRQIFKVILTPVGYTFVEDDNIIKIVSIESLAQEPVTTEVFLINYAKAEDILKSLAPLIDAAAGGKSVVDARNNALVITERPSQLSKMRPIIEKLDRVTAQVMIESKFIEVSNRDLKNIGVNWASLQGYGVGVGEMERSYEDEDTKESENTSNNERTDTTSSNLTNTTSIVNGVPTVSSVNTNQTGSTSSLEQLMNLTSGSNLTKTTTAVFSADDFRVVLSALQTMNDTKLVSNPTVVTLNNTEAEILVGDKYPIATPEFNPESGQITYDVTPQDIGVILKVTPQVNAQGFIKLQVQPEVSSLNGTVTIPGGAEYPIVATRTAKTQVSLRDGYTMGIGGLMEQSITKGESKVPVLGDIPLLGRLFRSNTKGDNARNMLIFITARSISPDGAPLEEVFDSRVIRKMKLERSELPGQRDGSSPFVEPELSESAKEGVSSR